MGNILERQQSPEKTYKQTAYKINYDMPMVVIMTLSDLNVDDIFGFQLRNDYTVYIKLAAKYSEVRLVYNDQVIYTKVIMFLNILGYGSTSRMVNKIIQSIEVAYFTYLCHASQSCYCNNDQSLCKYRHKTDDDNSENYFSDSAN
jgi:hypothetical protein